MEAEAHHVETGIQTEQHNTQIQSTTMLQKFMILLKQLTPSNPLKWSRDTWFRVSILVIILVTVLVFVFRFGLIGRIPDILRYVQSTSHGVVVFIALMSILGNIGIPMSVFSIGAGYIYKPMIYAFLIIVAGIMIGGTLGFFAGRFLFRSWIMKSNFANKNKTFKIIMKAVDAEGWKISLLVRLSQVTPFSVGNYLLSVTSIRYLPYLLTLTVGCLPGLLFFIYVGTLITDISNIGTAVSSDKKKRNASTIIIGSFIVSTLVIITCVSRRSWRETIRKMAFEEATQVIQLRRRSSRATRHAASPVDASDASIFRKTPHAENKFVETEEDIQSNCVRLVGLKEDETDKDSDQVVALVEIPEANIMNELWVEAKKSLASVRHPVPITDTADKKMKMSLSMRLNEGDPNVYIATLHKSTIEFSPKPQNNSLSRAKSLKNIKHKSIELTKKYPSLTNISRQNRNNDTKITIRDNMDIANTGSNLYSTSPATFNTESGTIHPADLIISHGNNATSSDTTPTISKPSNLIQISENADINNEIVNSETNAKEDLNSHAIKITTENVHITSNGDRNSNEVTPETPKTSNLPVQMHREPFQKNEKYLMIGVCVASVITMAIGLPLSMI